MKKTLAAVSLLLLAGPLVACGDSDSSGSGDNSGGSSTDYCAAVQSVKDEVVNKTFNTMGQAEFDDFQSKIDQIVAAAPDDVSGDWKTLGDFLGQFEKLLSDAGISIDDLQSMQSGELPPGADVSKLQALGTKLQSLTSNADLTGAEKAIRASAQKVCNIDIEGTSGAPSSASPSS